MHRRITRVVAAAGAGLSAVGISVASVSCGGTTTITTAPQPSHPSAAPGSQLWVQHYNGPGNGDDGGLSGAGFQPVTAVSPSGATVFVTGGSKGAGTGFDYATVAYDAATGARLWAGRYNGPGNGDDFATSVVVNRAGTVFVTGTSKGAGSGFDYATVAYRG